MVRRGVRRKLCDFDAVEVGEIGSDTDWCSALDGVECVVHLAARVHVMKATANSLTEFRRVNVAGTERLARQAAQQGVRRFIFLSSIKVNGEETVGVGFKERDRPQPQDAYGVSKWEAEQVLKKVSVETGMEVVILRPPLVYGPGVRGNFLRLMKLVALAVPLPFGAVENRRDLVYVGNLVDAIIACLEHPAAADQTFLVSDGESLATPELIRRLAQAMGKTPRMLRVPVFWFDWIGRVAGKATLQRLTGSLQIDTAHIRTTLRWQPPYSVDAGLRATSQWFLAGHGR